MNGRDYRSRMTLDRIVDHVIEQMTEWLRSNRGTGVPSLTHVEQMTGGFLDSVSHEDLSRIADVLGLSPAGVRDSIVHRVSTELVWVYYHQDFAWQRSRAISH